MAATIDLAEYKYTLTMDDSQYTQKMDEASNAAEGMKTKLSGIGSFLKTSLVAGLAAVGAAIAGTVVEGVKSYAELEAQMAQFAAATGASEADIAKVQDIAQELYKTNTDSMEDIVATSSAMMTQMGATVEQVESLQQAIMDFAKTTGMSNTEVVAAVDDIGDAWGLTAEESVAYLDVLKKSSEEYGTDVAAVTDALTGAAPAAKALGLSLDEVNGMMNLFADSGLDSTQAITALTYAAKSVESPEQFKVMLADIQALEDPTARAQKAVELFGARAGVALSNAFDDGTSLDDFILSVEECEGAVTDASAAFDNSFSVQLELMKKQFSGLAMEIGEKLMPTINSALSWVTDALPGVVSMVEGALSGLQPVFDMISGAISGVVTAIQGLVTSATTDGTVLNDVFNNIKTVAETVWNGISLVIGTVRDGIQELAGKLSEVLGPVMEQLHAWIQENMPEIQSVITTVYEAFSTIISGAVELIGSIIEWIGKLVKEAQTDGTALNAVWEGVKVVFETVWNAIKIVFKTVTDAIKNIFDIFSSAFRGDWEGCWEAVKNLFSGIWDGIKSLMENAFNGIVTLLKSVWGNVKEAATGLFNKVKEGFVEVWNNIKTWLSGILDTIVSTIKGFGTAIYNAGASIFSSLWDGIKSVWTSISNWVSDKVSWIADKLAFWRSSNNEMSADGSHAGGLPYVPFDGYNAILHKGERVLTAEENKQYKANDYTNRSSTQATASSSGDTYIDTIKFEYPGAISREEKNEIAQWTLGVIQDGFRKNGNPVSTGRSRMKD